MAILSLEDKSINVIYFGQISDDKGSIGFANILGTKEKLLLVYGDYESLLIHPQFLKGYEQARKIMMTTYAPPLWTNV